MLMNKWLKWVIGILLIFTVSGCFAEDYDVGIPSARLEVGEMDGLLAYPLTEANISWTSSSDEVKNVVLDIEEFGPKQNKIFAHPNQEARIDIIENEENSGSSGASWPDSIAVTLWKNGEDADLDVNEDGEFTFPNTEGTFVIEVITRNSSNKAQYVGYVEIKK